MNFINASGFVKKTWRFNHEKGTRHKTQSTGYRAQGVRHKAKDKKEKKDQAPDIGCRIPGKKLSKPEK